MSWEKSDNYLIYNRSILTNRPVASFDLDDTLIKPSDGKKFSEGRNDWELYDPSVPDRLKKLSKNYQIVIISNQNGISKGKTKAEDWQGKVEDFIKKVELPITVFASLKDSPYRKPRTKLWDEFLQHIDISKSFYCGDAGGLPKRKIKTFQISKDFSDSDLKFALNLGLKFKHRDEFIFDLEYPETKYKIDYHVDFNNLKTGDPEPFKPNGSLELIINVGYPGSGKTKYTRDQILPNGYTHVNQDILKTQPKCQKAAEDSLKSGKSCVIDNTNMTGDYRKKYIDIAKKYGANVRCFHHTCSLEQAMHNGLYRNFMTDGKVETIPKIVYYSMRKKYEEPELKEGINEIVKIPFTFNDVANESKYKRYYE